MKKCDRRRKHIGELVAEFGHLSAEFRSELSTLYSCREETIYSDMMHALSDEDDEALHYVIRKKFWNWNGYAKSLGIEQGVKLGELVVLYIKQGGVCNACGEKHKRAELQSDHIVPITKQGKHSIDNIQLLCPSCNHRKGTRIGNDWMLEENRIKDYERAIIDAFGALESNPITGHNTAWTILKLIKDKYEI